MIVTAKSRFVIKFPNFEKEDDLVSWCPYSLIGDSGLGWTFYIFVRILSHAPLVAMKAFLREKVDGGACTRVQLM